MIVDKNESFNIIGPAGTGKSHLIKQIHEELKKQQKTYISLAPTNKAARIINGMTLHKFASKLQTNQSMDNLNYDYIFIDGK